ncbi:MAG TPA: thioether cross-link-forming SCIFF peptide maturase [Candidatus Avacidaminococcus intestinavium]|uniref:Thioether cross-link-forming SCIFF peptide maturase n=1 Tax=Candidatus Avacidaminococcus intestinavium TaxID=2840684 RepID=A0A9D1SKU3_9FIRM|nr:thioether cross-link-forming SCIFF peptide maturase [Candidatus Avacidaminococcus intestinavium]
MKLDEHMAVLDVNSGAVHLVDELIYDILGIYDGIDEESVKKGLSDKYTKEEICEALAELNELKSEGLLFSPSYDVPDTFSEEPILKSLCLHIAHDCNLRCGYCFAGTGDFGGHRALMNKEIAEKAVEFAIAGSKMRHNLELDLFGGEPLVNPEVVKHVISYARQREKETGKNIKLTLTTNGTLLKDEMIEFLNEQRVMLVLSLDGKKETHDAMRPFPNKTGSYDAAVRGFKKVIDSRHGKNYYLRGTYTHYDPYFAEAVLDMAKIGKEISVEPVVGVDEPYVLTESDLPILMEEYDKLARIYLERRHAGKAFDFFHFNVALDNGPCVAKRLAGCGAGHEYYAITPEGDIYPCHQFVGREEYKLGNLETGILKQELVKKFRHTHVMTKPACSECWARFFCSGGCHANADLLNGDIAKPYEFGCKLQKKRLECAIIIQALLADEAQAGTQDLRPVIDNFKYKVE